MDWADKIAAGIACLWLSANRDVPPAERYSRFADAIRLASSFPTSRNPARGWGLPDAGKLLASAPVVPPPPTQPLPGKVTLSLADLTPESRTRLAAAGVTELSLTLGMTWPYPALAPAPTQTVPVRQPAGPVPGHWVPPAPPWHPPLPQSVPQTMPPPLILPAYQPFGGRFRPRW
jgi:hypothetical protein